MENCEICNSLDKIKIILQLVESHRALNNEGIAKKSLLPFGRSCLAAARHIIEEFYNLERMMGSLSNYFDYERYGREPFMYDYNMGAHRFSALLRKETSMYSVASDL